MKKGFIEWLKISSPDVLCLQEIKAMKDQIDVSSIEKLGYNHYWFSAEKKGYSGVAILSKKIPLNVSYGSGIDHMDFEGRIMRLDFEKLSIMSLYLPSGTNINRLQYKFKFMDEFRVYVDDLKLKFSNLVICGDYNICHQAIDIHDPVRNKTVSGFLPEERDWLNSFIKSGFVDSFRFMNPRPNQYTWWSYRSNARKNNKGWRIDYALVSESLKKNILKSFILPEVFHSDHCPVGLELKF